MSNSKAAKRTANPTGAAKRGLEYVYIKDKGSSDLQGKTQNKGSETERLRAEVESLRNLNSELKGVVKAMGQTVGSESFKGAPKVEASAKVKVLPVSTAHSEKKPKASIVSHSDSNLKHKEEADRLKAELEIERSVMNRLKKDMDIERSRTETAQSELAAERAIRASAVSESEKHKAALKQHSQDLAAARKDADTHRSAKNAADRTISELRSKLDASRGLLESVGQTLDLCVTYHKKDPSSQMHSALADSRDHVRRFTATL